MANLVSQITFYQQTMMQFFPKAIVMLFETVLQTKFYLVYIIPNLDLTQSLRLSSVAKFCCIKVNLCELINFDSPLKLSQNLWVFL